PPPGRDLPKRGPHHRHPLPTPAYIAFDALRPPACPRAAPPSSSPVAERNPATPPTGARARPRSASGASRPSALSTTTPPPVLGPDFKEFVALLAAHEVRYLIVGGYAVAYHGHPRFTGDLDVWIERSPENAARIATALDAFGFGGLG